MTTGKKGLELIKKYEGLRLEAYKCPAGIPTIGYGHTGTVNGQKIQMGMKITKDKAEDLLKKDLAVFEKGVSASVKVPLTQTQFDALVSFAYNLGVGSLQSSTLLKLLNQKKYKEAAEEFGKWVKGGGVVLPGLVKRRAEERELFLSDVKKAKKPAEKPAATSETSSTETEKKVKKPKNMVDNFTTKNWVKELGTSAPKYIVIHSTGNTAPAKNENANTVNNDNRGVGAHYTVDDKDIYHTLQDNRKIYHCGTAGYYTQKHAECRNANSIGIEMCQVDMKGTVAAKTIENTAKLVKFLMQKHNIPAKNVIRHYDVVSKECPIAYAGSNEKDEKWKKMKKILVG